MAKTRTSFVKGDPRCYRKGPPKLDKVIKEIRMLAREDLLLGFSEKFKWALPQLEEIMYEKDENGNRIPNRKTIAMDLGICTAIYKWIKNGDFRYVQPYIEYIFGKPKFYLDADIRDKRVFKNIEDIKNELTQIEEKIQLARNN